MKYLCLIFVIYLYIKSYFYADYEIKEKNNKPGGITIKVISFLRTYIVNYYFIYILLVSSFNFFIYINF